MTLTMASNGTNGTQNQTSIVQTIQSVLNDPVNVIFSGIIGTVISIILTPILREWFQKRQAYLKSYIEWCVRFAGILHEFEEICGYFRNDQPTKHTIRKSYNPMDVIFHLWYMHKSIDDGYKWLVMMKKDDQVAGENLDIIMDGVDRLWHMLESTYYRYLLKKDVTENDFKKILLDIKTNNSEFIIGMVRVIEYGIKNNNISFDYVRFRNVECYLYKKAPKRFWQIRTPSHSEIFPSPDLPERVTQKTWWKITNWISEEKFEIMIISIISITLYIIGELIKDHAVEHRDLAGYVPLLAILGGIILFLNQLAMTNKKLHKLQMPPYLETPRDSLFYSKIVLIIINAPVFLFTDLVVMYSLGMGYFVFGFNAGTTSFPQAWNQLHVAEIIFPILSIFSLWTLSRKQA